MSRARDFLRAHGQTLVNLFLFMCLGRYFVDKCVDAWLAEKFDLVEVAFALHNMVLLPILLIRRRHQAVDRNAWHQTVALVAFFSGIFFVSAPSRGDALLWASRATICAMIAISTLSLLSLGRSFGILIAVRQVKTGGLYRIVRHPMYLSDILWRMGFTLGNLSALNAALLLASSACYVYRALLEEKFLSQFPEYQEYREKVRYRFIPGVF